MLNLTRRIRKANREPNVPGTRPAAVAGTSSNGREGSKPLDLDATHGLAHGNSNLGSAPGPDPPNLQQALNRPLDKDFLQPLFLSKDDLQSIEANTTSVYRTLKPWQTRLLKIHSGDILDPLRCSLAEVDVIDGPGLGISGTSEIVTYEALSYAWGDPTVVCSLICNDTLVGIAQELATALQYLRSSTTDRYIWCDAICINQRDLSEKAHQVKNMLRIFEKADTVTAWLGQLCSSSGRLFEALQAIGSKSTQLLAHELRGCPRENVDSLISALNAHLASAWLTRTWVRQEVFAARKMDVQFGLYRLDFETFFVKAKSLVLILTSTHLPTPHIILPSTLPVYEGEYQHCGTDRINFEPKTKLTSYTQHLIEVLRSGSLFSVSDERDRVYGALGLLTGPSTKFFARLPANLESLVTGYPIDYKKEVSEVYQDITKFLINISKNLEILDIFRDRREIDSGNLPSWATDWSREREEFGLFHEETLSREGYSAVLQQDFAEVGKLRLTGVRLATGLTWLDSRKEMSHPRDRFLPKYRRSVTLEDILKGPTRRSYSGLAREAPNPPFCFVFTHIEETKTTFKLMNMATKPDAFDPGFASFLAAGLYAFAYVEDNSEGPSFELEHLHLLVPRSAALDDIVVSLYGSRCLHLLRPVSKGSSEFKYLGPVAGIACGQEQVMIYTPKNKFGCKSITKWTNYSQETFVII